MGNINDKVREMLEKKKQERLAREDIRSRLEGAYVGYRAGKLSVDSVREERRKVRNIYLERMQSVRPYDEDYVNDLQDINEQLTNLVRENGEYDPDKDDIST